MKIIAQVKQTYWDLDHSSLRKEEMSLIMKKDLLKKIDEYLLQYDQFFHEEDDRKNGYRLYEVQYIVLSLETFKELGKILRMHSKLDEYWIQQIQSLLVEKPKEND